MALRRGGDSVVVLSEAKNLQSLGRALVRRTKILRLTPQDDNHDGDVDRTRHGTSSFLELMRKRASPLRLRGPGSMFEPAQEPGTMTTEPTPRPPTSGLPNTGGPETANGLFPLVYEELRRLAHRHLLREPTGHTLSTTDLVHQAYMDLAEQTRARWQSRAQFMAVAAMAMRRILVDHARTRRSVKHGGALRRVPLESVSPAAEERADLLIALDEALERLRQLDERQVRVIECRFFGGMTEEETAEALGVAVRTARRDWVKAKSWLYGDLFPA
jgi:RNA polymerase sigma factor (TIGR02999 family)